MSTIFTAQRLASDGKSIITRWFDAGGQPLCYCLEPGIDREPHPCIPAGRYELKLRTIGQKHTEYQRFYGSKFGIGWHRGMVEITGVADREAIEFHIGNTIADTLGCSVSGTEALKPPGNGSGHWEVAGSRAAYERVYPILRDAILAGGVFLNIIPIGASV
jgi:hypothetical protein